MLKKTHQKYNNCITILPVQSLTFFSCPVDGSGRHQHLTSPSVQSQSPNLSLLPLVRPAVFKQTCPLTPFQVDITTLQLLVSEDPIFYSLPEISSQPFRPSATTLPYSSLAMLSILYLWLDLLMCLYMFTFCNKSINCSCPSGSLHLHLLPCCLPHPFVKKVTSLNVWNNWYNIG